uniref:AlNc14C736G12465 protein n=1 Tax=Albugo laibachii Nc14 TaxID=890382 RepID=F0X1Y8_9STRA|nr:AlNc14C736G12465 [Albugo laibachii Nc14]|eukprot:CCA27847.1 AlNc14C736G12465 [Albugo laibachii Nc14]
MGVRLTIAQQRTLVQHHENNEALTRHELGLCEKERFALPRAPSISNVGQLLMRFHAHPKLLQPCRVHYQDLYLSSKRPCVQNLIAARRVANILDREVRSARYLYH